MYPRHVILLDWCCSPSALKVMEQLVGGLRRGLLVWAPNFGPPLKKFRKTPINGAF